jgi:uncharacterized protein (TIGR00645 family)
MIELIQLVTQLSSISETDLMLMVLALIEVVMIVNLLFMVIISGYQTFVTRLELAPHTDQPEWLAYEDKMRAGAATGNRVMTIDASSPQGCLT